MGKRAMWELNAIILAVLVGGIILAIAWKATTQFTGPTNLKTCRLSVEAAATMRGTPSPFTLNRACATYIDEEMAKRDKEKALERISDRLWECWYMNGEGKYHAFEGRDAGKDAHCFICSQFTLRESVSEAELLRSIGTHRYPREQESVRSFLNHGILRWKGRELLTAERLVLPKDENTIQRIFSTITTDLNPDMPMVLKPFAIWNIWFAAADITPMPQLEPDTYTVVFYQVTPQYWRQTWEARAVTGIFDAETIKEITKVPPAKVFITKLSAVADSSCDLLQG